MIICSNCGATNNEVSGHICRKCGALLPTSRRAPRIRMDPKKKEIKETKPQKRIPDKKKVSKPHHLDLQDIPKPEKLNEIEDDLIETQTPFEYEDDEEFIESELEDEEDIEIGPEEREKRERDRRRRRELVYDEDLGVLVARRRRKRDDDLDEWEKFLR